MSKKRDIHVVPHPDGWATRKENADRVGVVTDTQSEASGEQSQILLVRSNE